MTKKNSGLERPVGISSALEEVIGRGPMSRVEVAKKLWEYIKKHKLQDAKDKRKINPDAKLAKVLGNNPIDMFQMTSKVSKHLVSQEPVMSAR